MAFASRLLERKKVPEDCTPMVKNGRYRGQLGKLRDLVAPPIKEVVIGVGERSVKIGGEEVMYRHQLTYYNPTAIAVDVSDNMSADEIRKRVSEIEGFTFVKMGQELRLDLIALRGASGDPERFASAATLITRVSKLPLILCSYSSDMLKTALEAEGVAERRPLIYAATRENWRDVAELAKRYGCPLAIYAPHNLDLLTSLSSTLQSMGVRDIVLDPGSSVEGGSLKDTVNNLVMLRRAGLRKAKALGYPVMCVSASVWAADNPDPVAASYRESYIASLFLNRYASLIIMHTLDIWALLPVVTLRQAIYTDPRKPVSIDPGLREFGNVGEKSPVMLTTNFALTYYTVANDLESSGVEGYLLVLNTEGLSVETSVAGGQFTSAGVKDLIESSGVEKRVRHRRLVIPGKAARLKGDIEDTTGWDVLIGPQDSSEIKDFLGKHWSVDAKN